MSEIVWVPIELKETDLDFKLFAERAAFRFDVIETFYVPAEYLIPETKGQNKASQKK